ncbi:hypothetical protein BV25DRAFT_1709223 [Artomyces pyxidatus]|uniref:Uncharacterized protein n=1 Tax=Artomyces pyxidatus TaxID=48021 RepID=A0ACB8T9K3_9AGAM|nr:hypothetical protein BV25DRAFT_1709223 [Artomyces pyxidatus]
MVRLITAVKVLLAAATASALPAPNRVTFAVSDDASYSVLDPQVLHIAQILAGHTLDGGALSAAYMKRSPQSDSSGGGGGSDSSGGGSDNQNTGWYEYPWWLYDGANNGKDSSG